MLTNERGSSLVEIMVALVIFGIGLSMAMRNLPESSAKTTRSRNMSIAVNLAQEKLEDLMALSFIDADLSDGTHADPDNPINGHYDRSWTVVADSPLEGMKDITVRVTFPTASSDSVRTLRTFISRKQ